MHAQRPPVAARLGGGFVDFAHLTKFGEQRGVDGHRHVIESFADTISGRVQFDRGSDLGRHGCISLSVTIAAVDS